MRLWHEALLPKLDGKRICGQYRECIALLGNGWGKKHSTVNYVFRNPEHYLVAFTYRVVIEMQNRGYKPNVKLIRAALKKRHNDIISIIIEKEGLKLALSKELPNRIYLEHDDNYYNECIENLKQKGINIDG